jgi:hypothetical protein
VAGVTQRVAALRPLGVAEILDGAVRGVRRNLRPVLTIAAPYAVVRTVCAALLQLGLSGSASATLLQGLDVVLVAGVLDVVLAGALAPVFTDELLGHAVTARQAVARIGRRWGWLVVLAIVVAAGETAGLVGLVVGGVWLWGVWAVAAPVLAVERTSAFGALGRSLHLVSGNFWRTWGVRALGRLLTTVLGLLITLPFEVLAGLLSDFNPFGTTNGTPAYPALFVWITAAGGLVSALLVGPIGAAIDSLLYVDLRMRREGLDIVLNLPPEPLATPPPTAVSAW